MGESVSNDDAKASLEQEIKRLNLENSKLSRELRMTNSFLEKVKRTIEAKDALGTLLTADNVKQRAYTDMLLDSCPNIIFLLDDDGKFVLCTKALLTAANCPNFDYVKGRTYTDVFSTLVSADISGKISSAVNKVLGDKETIVLNEYIDFGKTGSARYYTIELMIVEGRTGGNVGISAGILAVFTDLTDFMFEKERSDLANRAKSDFLAAMSHEIRTPMNAILGMTEIVSRSELNAQQQKQLSDIKKSSHALLAIINDILDFSKIEAGKMDIVEGFYNLKELLDNICAMFEPLFKAKSLDFRFSIEPTLPQTVYGDENRLRQILTNILSNALKYTPTGAVTFSSWLTDDEKLRFDVSDTGVGIHADDIPKLFTPFEQLDLRKNRNIVGTGLGLAISHKLCRMMGGDLWVESVYGEGSTFSIEIPCVAVNDDCAGQAPSIDIESFLAKDAKVLVVDDIEINLSVAEAMLQIFGITPDLAGGGATAIECALESKYDIIFMDQMMPEMDGIETTNLIRTLCSGYESTPIIALTANVINGAEKMLLKQGFNDFLAKPLEIDALNICLRKWLPAELIEITDE